MKKSEWSDKQLEELLRQMPKIHDHRNPRDIYQNLSIKKRKAKTWLVHGFAAGAAIILIMILLPKLIPGMQFSGDSADKSTYTGRKIELAAEKRDSSVMMKKNISPLNHQEKSGTAKIKLLSAENIKTAAYQSDVQNREVLTYWIPDRQGQILIPVSKIVNRERNKSWITLFNENMAALTEEEWGLSEYYPVNARLTYNKNDNSVNVDVPANHPFGQGAANETIFVNALKQDISSNSKVKMIKLTTEGKPGINFGNFGVLQKLPIIIDRKRAYFRYIPIKRNKPFLVPSQNKYKDIQAALKAMKTDKKELGLKASLLPSFQVNKAIIKNSNLYVTLKENVMMKNDVNTMYCLEALLLTAKEFGAKGVVITNAPFRWLCSFDLSKQIKVPIAPNLR